MLRLGLLGAGHLPVLFSIVFVTNLGLTYVLAVRAGHVDPLFPYMSADGDTRPESCVFSLLLNICSILSMLIVWLRTTLVSELVHHDDHMLQGLNKISVYFGMAGGFAMMIVANFQETAVTVVHLSAAFICFSSGCLYMFLQSAVTIRMAPMYANARIGKIRLALSVLSAIALISAITFGRLAAAEFHRYFPDLPTPRPWNRKTWQPGYGLHEISAVSEWMVGILHVLFVLSFSRDFEKLHVSVNYRMISNHLDISRVPSYHNIAEVVP